MNNDENSKVSSTSMSIEDNKDSVDKYKEKLNPLQIK